MSLKSLRVYNYLISTSGISLTVSNEEPGHPVQRLN